MGAELIEERRSMGDFSCVPASENRQRCRFRYARH